jgi:hypothetical protein
MKRLLFVLTIALVALSLNSAPVAAQAIGSTNIDISLPDIVILHYFSEVDVTITATDMGNFLIGTPGDSSYNEGSVTATAGLALPEFQADLNLIPSGLTGDASAAVLRLQNAWAVRSTSLIGGTNTELAITVDDTTLDHVTTTAEIEITDGIVDDGANSGATIEFPATGLYNPRIGDVVLTLDLTDALQAGEYADGVFTLTATNV